MKQGCRSHLLNRFGETRRINESSLEIHRDLGLIFYKILPKNLIFDGEFISPVIF